MKRSFEARARAHPNIALVKYWGKRDERLMLPHQSSLSLTFGPLSVETVVRFGATADDDVVLHGRPATGPERQRVLALVALVRDEVADLGPVQVTSTADFPMAAGLASSAAAFAALAVATRSAAGLPRDVRAESALARRGSGSACRSIEGGFCVWARGVAGDGCDSVASQIFPESYWPQLRLVVAEVSGMPKRVSSRDGMRHTVETSPFYPAWVETAEADVQAMAKAVEARDLGAVGALAERNAWRMHATALGAHTPVCYLEPATLAVVNALPALRERGLPVWFTLDAGPNPVLLTLAPHVDAVVSALGSLGVKKSLVAAPAGGVALLSR